MLSKQTLKLIEFYQLDIELNGFATEGQVHVKGILNENLPLVAKYWLTQLSQTISGEKQVIEKFRENLIRKYGTPDENGNILINKTVDGEDNPNWINFQNDWNMLLIEEKEVNYKPIKLEDLETVHSSSNYPLLFRFVSAE